MPVFLRPPLIVLSFMLIAVGLPDTDAMAGAGNNVRLTVEGGGAGIATAGVAVRVEGEGERERLRIAAFANDALRRAGLRPDATAGAQLYLKFERPRTLSVKDKPDISVIGRGGSSSHAQFGLEVQVPTGDEAKPSEPAPHRLTARLERSPGQVVWRAEAEIKAVPGKGERGALKLLARKIARALAKAAKRD